MDKITQKDIDWLLNLNKEEQEDAKPSSKKKISLRLSLWFFLIFGLSIFPFFALLRTSIYLNLNHGWNGWLALGGGMLISTLLLLTYILFLFKKAPNKKILMKFSLGGTSALVLAFCLYGVFYLSSVNAKNQDIRDLYRSMHPILRVAIATTTLADNDLVITDIQRQPEDYAAMGLSTKQASLHYTQSSGYVHAIDLRTIGHSEFRNFILRSSLELVGLNTLRHIGTADHLHVSLPIYE